MTVKQLSIFERKISQIGKTTLILIVRISVIRGLKDKHWIIRFRIRYLHLFVTVPRPGDSEGTFSVFESSCHLLLPV